MSKSLSIALCAFLATATLSQAQYTFTHKNEVKHTAVKDQQQTGTCWSFATHSFLESEVLRIKKQEVNFSEMYVVRQTYLDKVRNYSLRQGKAQFSEGGLSHDVMNCLKRNGLMPESAYLGKATDEQFNDGELKAFIQAIMQVVVKGEKRSNKWLKTIEAILDVYLGSCPTDFTYNNKKYTPRTFADDLGLDAKNYWNFTSFSHHPFYEQFVLEIPDNYANGSYMNVPMEELEQLVDKAIENGYTVAWDGDVSEEGFSQEQGLAILPLDKKVGEDTWKTIQTEVKATQALRQAAFENLTTGDDHLMHLVGIANDSKGNKYYIIKNSWGEEGKYKGYLYMSLPYFYMKTVGLTLHKDAVAKDIRKRFD